MFKKYMHIRQLGSSEADGLLAGRVYVQPKIDGANAQLWWDGFSTVMIGSRNKEVDENNDLMGFNQWVKDNETRLSAFFREYPTWRLYGEWLVPHSLKTYRDDAWRNFYVFDVFDDETDQFVPIVEYIDKLKAHDIEFVPLLAIVDNPTEEYLRGYLERNTYLIKDGAGVGEGIVIKRYDFRNKYGRTTWGKLVRNEFKEKNAQEFGVPNVKLKQSDEAQFAAQYVTRGRIDKELAKIGDWNSRMIPQLFGIVYHDLVTEELWDYLKSKKNKVTIDFNSLYQHVIARIKSECPELF